jgi:superfamily II DNA or RNA helicase
LNGKDVLFKQAFEAIRKANYDGIVLLPTGTGKGRLMIEVAKVLDPKNILYLCNTTLLRDKMFIDELHKWDAGYLLGRTDLYCYQSACKWNGEHYSLLLADEFDSALTTEYIKVFKNNTFDKRILVSATLDDEKLRKAKKIAPIIFERKPAELAEDRVVNKVRFYFVNFDLTPEENTTYLHYNAKFRELLNSVKTKAIEAELQALQLRRKQFLSRLQSGLKVTKWLISNIEKTGEKILVFCGLSEQADRVCKHSYHNQNDEEQLLLDFDSGKIRTLAVVNKVDRGLNIADIRNIIHESIGKSKTRLTQRNGRGMRLAVDETLNTFFLIPHFRTRRGERKATVVQSWVFESTKDMDLKGAKTIEFKT